MLDLTPLEDQVHDMLNAAAVVVDYRPGFLAPVGGAPIYSLPVDPLSYEGMEDVLNIVRPLTAGLVGLHHDF